MICELWIKKFFCPFSILWYKFLSCIEVLHVLSEHSKLLELSELIELPEVFSSMKKHLLHGALRLGDPLLELLELRFVSLSSETSRSFGTTQTSQSSIGSHPAFPDELISWRLKNCNVQTRVKCACNLKQKMWKSIHYGIFRAWYVDHLNINPKIHHDLNSFEEK